MLVINNLRNGLNRKVWLVQVEMELNVSNLSVAFGFKLVIDNLSFRLRQGQVLQIKGANGVGKSVLLQTIDKGHKAIENGFSTLLINQNDGIKPELLVREQLAFWTGLAQRQPCLQSWNLPMDSPIQHISLGQKQRLSLSRLDILDSDLWLLDEPYHGLDSAGQNILNDKILNKTITGSVIIVSHNALNLPVDQIIELPEVCGNA